MSDIKIMINNVWQPARDYQIKAYLAFMEGGQKPLVYWEHDIHFTVKTNPYNNFAVIERADGSESFIYESAGTRKCSFLFKEAKPVVADTNFFVDYQGTIISVKKNTRYYIDNNSNVLVGWHGSVSPPLDMGGESLVRDVWNKK